MNKRIGAIVLSIFMMVGLFGCSSSGNGKKITVGSKDYTENIVLGHIIAELVEAQTDITVVRKMNMSGSSMVWEAIQNDDIQVYPDYTGTLVIDYYQSEAGTSEETLNKAIEFTSKDGLVLTSPLGFDNTYTLAVTQETAEKYGLKTFSDLVAVAPELTLGCEFEFVDREDAYPGLQKAYGMNFKEVTSMNKGIMYKALNQENVDVIDAYSTDGQLVVNDLVILEDDLEFFPPYDSVPVVRKDTLEKYPELEDVLNQLGGLIDEDTMQSLNAKVDSEGLKAQDVAHDFLVSKGLIEE